MDYGDVGYGVKVIVQEHCNTSIESQPIPVFIFSMFRDVSRGVKVIVRMSEHLPLDTRLLSYPVSSNASPFYLIIP